MPAPSEPIFPILAIIANPAMAAELDDLLRGTSLQIDFAASALEGLQKAEALLPNTILIDIDPNLESYETCRRLRAIRSLNTVPILMICPRADRDTRAAGLSAGADDFIEKPLDGLEILSRLRTITRLNSQRLLLAHLTRFSWIVDHIQDGYLLLDRHGSIIYANERAVELLNLADDFIGLSFVQAVEWIYQPEPIETWATWLQEPESCFLVLPETPTARAGWLILEAMEMDLGSEYQRIVRLRDVTERMSIYQDMRRFHTVVSHKLRTPMSLMITNLNLLNRRLDMLSPEEIREYVRGAIGGADRLAGEIRKILTYIDAPLALNLGEAVSLAALPEILAETGKILGVENIILSLPEHLQAVTLALTTDALEMILHELVENSRKFHPSHNPTIEFSVSQSVPEFVNIRYTDNGQRLSPEQMRWAWLPYVQGEKDFTGELPGMGLGFPMIATLVWKAGGDLRLRNRPDGFGVLVEMKIPLESTARSTLRQAQPLQKN